MWAPEQVFNWYSGSQDPSAPEPPDHIDLIDLNSLQ